MISRVIRTLAVVLILSAVVYAQAPVVGAGGIVNAASYRPANAPGTAIAPGSIVSIFGTNLASATALAPPNTFPLATALGGTSVTIGGKAAALFFVAAGQINAQVPWSVAAGSQAVVVTTSKGTSAAQNVTVGGFAPAIFSMASSGKGPGVVQNYINPTTAPVNDANIAVVPGNWIVVYATGLGAVQNPPADGVAGAAQPTTNPVTVLIGGRPINAYFAGLAPYFVGLYQVNVQLPSDMAEGCYVPLQLSVGGVVGNTVTISVAKGGNCASIATSAPSAGRGQSFGGAGLARVQTDMGSYGGFTIPPMTIGAFGASFVRVTGVGSSSYPPVNAGCVVDVFRSDDSPSTMPGEVTGTMLDAGTLTLSGPGLSATQITRNTAGAYAYAGAAGSTTGLSIQSGTWVLNGGGGKDIGSFGPVNLAVPAAFSLKTSSFSGGTLNLSQNLTATWTCPDSSQNSMVAAEVITFDTTAKLAGLAMCTASCSAGTITIPSSTLKQLPGSGSAAGLAGFVYIPDYTAAPQIKATGLDLGFFAFIDMYMRAGLTVTP